MWEAGWAAGHLKNLLIFVEYINIVHPLIRNNGKELHPKIGSPVNFCVYP